MPPPRLILKTHLLNDFVQYKRGLRGETVQLAMPLARLIFLFAASISVVLATLEVWSAMRSNFPIFVLTRLVTGPLSPRYLRLKFSNSSIATSE